MGTGEKSKLIIAFSTIILILAVLGFYPAAGLPHARLGLMALPKSIVLGVFPLLVSLFGLKARHKDGEFRLDLIDCVIFAFVISGALSSLFSKTSVHAVNWTLSFYPFILGTLALRRLLTAEDLPAVSLALAAVSASAGAVAIAEAGGFVDLTDFVSAPPGGTLGARNILSAVLVFGAVSSLSRLALGGLRKVTLSAYTAAFVISLSALVLTRSRTAWLSGLIVVTLCALALLIRRNRVAGNGGAGTMAARLFLLAFLGWGVAALTAEMPWPGISWRVGSPYLESLQNLANLGGGTGADRVSQYKVALYMWIQNPIWGVGPGGWRAHAPLYYPMAHGGAMSPPWIFQHAYPDAEMARILGELGTMGILTVAAFWWLSLAGWSTCRGIPKWRRGLFSDGILEGKVGQTGDLVAIRMGLLAILICSFGDSVMGRAPTAVMATVALAAVTCQSRVSASQAMVRPEDRRRGLAFWSLLILCGMLLSIGTLQRASVYYPLMTAHRSPDEAIGIIADYPAPIDLAMALSSLPLDIEQCGKYREELKNAIAMLPYDPPLLYRGAMCAKWEGDLEGGEALMKRYRELAGD